MSRQLYEMSNLPFLVIISVFFLQGCVVSDYEGETQVSSSGIYSMKTTVDMTSPNNRSEIVGRVIAHVYDNKKQEVIGFDTGAIIPYDWMVGWSIEGDTIIMKCEETGNKAWVFYEWGAEEVEMTPSLNRQVEKLEVSWIEWVNRRF